MAIKNRSTLTLVQLGILLALVIVLQSLSSVGVITVCLCLVPITLGAILLGWRGGLILGAAFGVVALIWGIAGKDMFTFYLFQANPAMTIAICLVKGSLAGVIPAFVYRWVFRIDALGNSRGLVASIVASITAPIVNSGIFALGCLIIQEDVINVAGKLKISAANFVSLLFIALIGVNFLIELAINIIFAPALNKVTRVILKQLR